MSDDKQPIPNEEKMKKEKKEKKKKTFDFSTIIGWTLGMTVVIMAIYTNAQMEGLVFFVQLSSILIVVGGLSAAIIVNFSIKDIINAIKLVGKSMKKDESENLEEKVDMFVSLVKESRKSGMLSLEDKIKTIDDEFMKKGLKLAIDGYSEDEVQNILQKELNAMEDRHIQGQELIERAGDYAPAWGMIGTLIGLVLMLMDLDDPSSLGPSMAVAMLTTLYGALIANLFLIPLLGKLEFKHNREVFEKHFIMEGVLEVQQGQNPLKLKTKLNSFIKKKPVKKDKKSKEGEKNEEEKNNG
jgi:chemotaxis protein MotA